LIVLGPTGRAKKSVGANYCNNTAAWEICLTPDAGPKASGSRRASRFDPAIDKKQSKLLNTVAIGQEADSVLADGQSSIKLFDAIGLPACVA
jgi:hypothetical protein